MPSSRNAKTFSSTIFHTLWTNLGCRGVMLIAHVSLPPRSNNPSRCELWLATTASTQQLYSYWRILFRNQQFWKSSSGLQICATFPSNQIFIEVSGGIRPAHNAAHALPNYVKNKSLFLARYIKACWAVNFSDFGIYSKGHNNTEQNKWSYTEQPPRMTQNL